MSKEQIINTLKTFIGEGNVTELRIFKYNKYGHTYSGYYDNFELLAKEAMKHDGKVEGLYFIVNKCKDVLLSRAVNRFKKAEKGDLTSDVDIEKYTWFLIDADVKRPAKTSTTDKEHNQAIDKCRDIMRYLTRQGWPEPVASDSGNGSHLCYKIDIENTKENIELIKKAILALSNMFSDDNIDIDKKVFNPSRIWKLYGTTAKKGDVTSDRPHRQAKILYTPKNIETVSKEQIMALTESVKSNNQLNLKNNKSYNGEKFNIDDWFLKYGIDLSSTEEQSDGSCKYVFKNCPFNSEHKNEAAVFKNSDGTLTFNCFHDSCYGKKWADVRELYEPKVNRQEYKPKQYQQNNYQNSYQNNYQSRFKPQKPTLPITERVDVANDLEKMLANVERQKNGELTTLELPWKKLSDASGALRPSSVLVLAGPSKTGKSFFMMNIIKKMHEEKVNWAYLPLEDSRRDWSWRMLAIIEEDYRMIDIDNYTAQLREDALMKRTSDIAEYLERVTENPRMGITDDKGEPYVPKINYDGVLSWIKKKVSEGVRIIVVDPLSQIETDAGQKEHEAQADFVRGALGLVADKNTTLIIVCHTIKKGGALAGTASTGEDVQGSAMITRLTHTTLLIDACEMTTGHIKRRGDATEECIYNRVVTIATARNGGGTRDRHAFLQHKNEPKFVEFGVLTKEKKE